VAITWLGISHYFEAGNLYAAYFDESVQGLDKDSPVKYRGVPVGRVVSIGVAPDSTLIEVVMKIEPGLALENYINDITAQLTSVSITGIVFVGLDRKRPGYIDRSPKITFKSKYPVIATEPSDIKKYMEGLEDVLNQLSAMDVKGISTRVKDTLDRLNRTIEDAKINDISVSIQSSLSKLDKLLSSKKWYTILDTLEKASASIDRFGENADNTAAQVRQMVARLDSIIIDNETGISTAIKDFQDAMGNADRFMENGSELIKKSNSSISSLVNHLLITEQNLQSATENLNRFIEIIASQPSQLIFSEPPAPRKINK
jgi:phospholipid/cholesterol/gamma-HCH transport system substrate-binding protein